jgi:4-carboxymuconolactone decarboxylase
MQMKRTERIKPLALEECNEEQLEALKPWSFPDGTSYNLFRTFARHPDMLKRWRPFGMHVMTKSTLPVRDREIIIMRVAWLNRSNYEWGHHAKIALEAGLTEEDLKRVIEGAEAPEWTAFERLLIQATDELKQTASLTDQVYSGLAKEYDEKQMLDLVYTYGAYNMVSTSLNVFGVQLEEGFRGIESFK